MLMLTLNRGILMAFCGASVDFDATNCVLTVPSSYSCVRTLWQRRLLSITKGGYGNIANFLVVRHELNQVVQVPETISSSPLLDGQATLHLILQLPSNSLTPAVLPVQCARNPNGRVINKDSFLQHFPLC